MFPATATLVYNKIWLTDFFHRFPHLDFSFSETSVTFDPENEKYREALLWWASLPLICCLVLWLVCLIFFCCRKRPTNQCLNKPRRCCSCNGIFLMFGCATIVVALYGNAELHKGVDNSLHAMRSTKKTLQSSQQIVNVVTRLSDSMERKQIPELMKAVSGITNSSVRSGLVVTIQQIGQCLNSTKEDVAIIKNRTSAVDTAAVADRIDQLEDVRYFVVIVICCTYIVLCLLIFAGLLMKSRKKLTVAAVMTMVFIMPAMWAVVSVHLTLAIGSGDLCVDPNSFVLSQLNNTTDEELLSDYLDCKDKSQPFGEQMLNAQTAVSQALTALNTTVAMSSSYNISDKLAGPVHIMSGDLQLAFGNLSSLNSLVGSCLALHNEYILVVRGVCVTSLYGTGYMVLAALLAVLCSAVLVFGSAVAWTSFGRRVRGREDGHEPVDDTDPFVPSPVPRRQSYGTFRPVIHHAANPYLADAVNINDGDRPQDSEDLDRESPPDTYFSNRLQEYADLAPRPTSILHSL